ncbi:MAG TPA: S24 family peptidase [Reyranellaceae bacterium]|nr:S24 family peptidase [Reyranellaceae bacterium]
MEQARKMDAPRKLLVDTLAQRPDLDLKKLSLAIGRNHAYLQQFLMRGSPRELPEAARHALAPLLGVSPDDLRSYAPPSGDGTRLGGDLRVAGPLRAAERADLPVYASAEGGGGAIVITSEPIDFVRRPEPLLSVRDGYGCYVIGDSMSPAYEQGDLLLIHPGKPVRPGDDCVFVREQTDGTQHALVKRLLRTSTEKFRVRQFNPARDFDLDRAQWTRVQLIVGKYSR